MIMTDLFDDQYQPGRILIKTVGSAGPGNSWVSAIAFTQIDGKIEVWYSPDLTEVYQHNEEDYDDYYDEPEFEPYLLGSIESEFDNRELISWLSLNKPEGFYFDEITIQGVKGFWKDLFEISLYEGYGEALDHLLSLSDEELRLFWDKNRLFKHESHFIKDVLNQINRLFDEKINEADLRDHTFAQILKHPKIKIPFDLGSLEETLDKIIEEEFEEELEL